MSKEEIGEIHKSELHIEYANILGNYGDVAIILLESHGPKPIVVSRPVKMPGIILNSIEDFGTVIRLLLFLRKVKKKTIR